MRFPVTRAAALLLPLALACTVDIRDFAGRACDATHPCTGSRVCKEGFCAPGEPAETPDGSSSLPCGADGGDCAAGQGECRRVGEWVCRSGAVHCSAEPGNPVEETCDGRDNDCDGRVDVSEHTALVTAGSANAHLSWAAAGGGYAAVYQSNRPRTDGGAGIDRVFFRRFDARLSAQGAEVELSDPTTRGARAPSLATMGADAYAIWADEGSGGADRVTIVKVSATTGAVAFRRVFSGENVVGSPRVSIASDGQYVLGLWIRSPSTLVGATVTSSGTVFQDATVLAIASTDAGVAHKVVEADALNVGNNDFQIAWTHETGTGSIIRSQRIEQDLSAHTGNVIAQFTSAAGAFQPRLVTNLDANAGDRDETALIWKEIDVTKTPPTVSLRGSPAPSAGRGAGTMVGPVGGGSWAANVVPTSNGPLMVWMQQEDGALRTRSFDGGMALEIPSTAGPRSFSPLHPPALARANGFVAVGYALDGGLYGEVLCEP